MEYEIKVNFTSKQQCNYATMKNATKSMKFLNLVKRPIFGTKVSPFGNDMT